MKISLVKPLVTSLPPSRGTGIQTAAEEVYWPKLVLASLVNEHAQDIEL